MATTTHTPASLALMQIHVPENVRALSPEHVDALAGSIALQGVLVPVVVRPAAEGYELVAGFHRVAAAAKLGLKEIPVVHRQVGQQDADRAVENIARQQLNAYEQARAVKAMLDSGLSEDGAAQALGWPRARISARVKILALPARAQQMLGAGELPLGAVDQLRVIGEVSPALLGALIEYVDDVDRWAVQRLTSEPGWVLGQAIRHGASGTFAAFLSQIDAHQSAELRLGKKTEALYAEAEGLYKQLTPYAYGPPPIRFAEADVDRARAAGVLIELERGAPIIVERPLYRELAKAAIKRTAEELRVKAAERAEQKKRERRRGADAIDPAGEAARERDRQLRALSEQAHGVNLDLGASLLNGLSAVDPADMDVARFFVYALLGPDHDGSAYTQSGERIAQLALGGIRLVVGELRTDVTKTRKDGSRGRMRIDYGQAREPQALKWLWRYVEGAGSAGELYGRALVVIAAEQYAARIVLPASQRGHAIRWGSRKDLAAKALSKLAGPHLPASLKALERAVQRVHQQAELAIEAARAQQQSGEDDLLDVEEQPCEPLGDA